LAQARDGEWGACVKNRLDVNLQVLVSKGEIAL